MKHTIIYMYQTCHNHSFVKDWEFSKFNFGRTGITVWTINSTRNIFSGSCEVSVANVYTGYGQFTSKIVSSKKNCLHSMMKCFEKQQTSSLSHSLQQLLKYSIMSKETLNWTLDSLVNLLLTNEMNNVIFFNQIVE